MKAQRVDFSSAGNYRDGYSLIFNLQLRIYGRDY